MGQITKELELGDQLNKDRFVVVDNFLAKDFYEELYEQAMRCDDWDDSKTIWVPLLSKDPFSDSEVRNSVKISRTAHMRQYLDGSWQINNNAPGWDNKLLGQFQHSVMEFLQAMGIALDKLDKPTAFTRIHKVPEESSILWHDDGSWAYAIMYYLNKEWEPNWGGELLLENHSWMPIKSNRLAIMKPPIYHRTNSTARSAPDRMSFQTFIGEANRGEQQNMERERGTLAPLPATS